MADYFTDFSLVLNLPTQEAQDYALEIHRQASRANLGDDLPKGSCNNNFRLKGSVSTISRGALWALAVA